MEYKVETKELGDQGVVCTRLKTALSKIDKDIGRSFEAIYGYADKAGLRPVGPPFILYYDTEMKEDDVDMEVCAPVIGEASGEGDVTHRVQPGGKFLSTVHTGPYKKIGAAYEAVMSHARDNSIELTVPSREVYLTDPNQVKSPAENVTEVLIPYE